MVTLLKRSTLLLVLPLCLSASAALGGDSAPRVPTVDDLLQLKVLSRARISPDGKWVAYGVSHTDFRQDAFISQLWLADTATGRTLQLTRGEKSAAIRSGRPMVVGSRSRAIAPAPKVRSSSSPRTAGKPCK